MLPNKLVKLLHDTKCSTWIDVMAAAVEGYNCSVRMAISSEEAMVPVAPTELWYGRNTVADSIARWLQQKDTPSDYAKLLKSKIETISSWAKQSRQKYQQWMENGSKKKKHKLRKFEADEEVLLYTPMDSKKLSKISAAQRGPYRVTKVHPNGVSYDIKLIGSSNKRDSFKVRIDRIRKLRGWNSVELSSVPGSKKAVAIKKTEY